MVVVLSIGRDKSGGPTPDTGDSRRA